MTKNSIWEFSFGPKKVQGTFSRPEETNLVRGTKIGRHQFFSTTLLADTIASKKPTRIKSKKTEIHHQKINHVVFVTKKI